jgi:D-aminopeptidase
MASLCHLVTTVRQDALMPSIREVGITIGTLPTGTTNSVADVTGVGVGHTTIVRDESPHPEGRGTARTGVSVISIAEDAYRHPVPAGGAVLNGAGECTGFITAGEWGSLETPILLTSTMQLGRVYDAACELMIEEDPDVGAEVVIPVVGECDDSYLNDAGRMQVTRDDVVTAWRLARIRGRSGEAAEQGSVGAGTGMACLGFKGGIGESSRVTPSGHTVAVLLMTNFGERNRLTVDGIPAGRLLHPDPYPEPDPAGSCIGVVITDAPVDGAGCARLARRIGLGLARTGSTAHNGSGEIFMAAATGLRRTARGGPLSGAALGGDAMNDLFEAVVDSAEEAVLNSMAYSPTMFGRNGHGREGLPLDALRALVSAR